MGDLYSLDEEARAKFTREQEFRGRRSKDLRSNFYEQSFGPSYELRTIPKQIPTSIDAYVELFNCSTRLFPNDKFFQVRDMSYIRPTRHGTMEFRSSCSFHDASDILEVISFRRQQVFNAIKPPRNRLKKLGGA